MVNFKDEESFPVKAGEDAGNGNAALDGRLPGLLLMQWQNNGAYGGIRNGV